MIYSRHSKGYAKKQEPKQQELDLQENSDGRGTEDDKGAEKVGKNRTPKATGTTKRTPKKEPSNQD